MGMNNTHRIALAVGILIGAAIGVPVGPAIINAQAQPAIQEDDPGWDCRTMGMRDCGPANTQGVTAGCYNDAAELVAVWPCHVVVNADGSADVFEGYDPALPEAAHR